MKSDPLVTIGIPFRNPGRFLPLAIKSVFAQTIHNWELILLDDGSTDGSVEFAKQIHDKRVQVVVDGENNGLATRLNQIARMARGDILVRMDADDMMHPLRLKQQVGILTQCKSEDENVVVGSWAIAIDANDIPQGLRVPAAHEDEWSIRHRFIHPTVAAATSWFRSNPYSESAEFLRCEDAELWLRTSHGTKRAIIEEPLLYYREVGVYSHANYMATARGLHRLIDRVGGPIHRRWRRHAQEYAKVAAMWASARLGISDALIRRRSALFSLEMQGAALAGIERIHATSIPGINS